MKDENLTKATLKEFVELNDKEMKLVVGGSGGSGDESSGDCGGKSESDCSGSCTYDTHQGSCKWVKTTSTCTCATVYYDPD